MVKEAYVERCLLAAWLSLALGSLVTNMQTMKSELLVYMLVVGQ